MQLQLFSLDKISSVNYKYCHRSSQHNGCRYSGWHQCPVWRSFDWISWIVRRFFESIESSSKRKKKISIFFHIQFLDQEVYAFTYQVRRGLISLGSISLVGDRARIVRIRCSRNGVSCHVQKGDNIVEHSPSQIAIYFATCCYCQKLLLPVEVKHFNEHNENKDDDLVWATQKMTECMHRNPKFQYNPDAIDPFQRFVRQFEAVFAQFREELAG